MGEAAAGSRPASSGIRALEFSWDHEHGGMVYGFDIKVEFYDEDKYFWVQAESLAAAALLADQAAQVGDTATEARYWNDYDRLWAYSWDHFVDHKWGAWYRILACDNTKYSNNKSSRQRVQSSPAESSRQRSTIIPWAHAMKY